MSSRSHILSKRWIKSIGLAWLCLAGGTSLPAAGLGETPISCFTNLGGAFLQTQSNSLYSQYSNYLGNFGIINIPISPTNLYLPAIHRLLQVAANIYDTTTNDPFPSVFLPEVSAQAGSAHISGYVLCTNRQDAVQWMATNDYGLPAVVGAKKGLPNFNEVVFQTFFQIGRKLELGRLTTNSLPNQTNQIMLLSLSNLFGVENWNSYSRPLTNNYQVFISNSYSFTLSNAVDGFSTNFANSASVDYPVYALSNANCYFKPQFPIKINADGGFLIPLYTNVSLLTNARYFGGGFDGLTNSYLPRTGELPVADWRLIISNRLTYLVSTLPENPTVADLPSGRVLDLVSLSYATNLNLTDLLMLQDPVYPAALARLWDTNRVSFPATRQTPTEGIIQQIAISLGNPVLSDTDWKSFNNPTDDKQKSIDNFRGFVANTNHANSNLYQQAPFTAIRKFVHTVTWQANDPLVHYLAQDLGGTNGLRFLKPNDTFTNNSNLGRLNYRYQPWLGNPNYSAVDDSSAVKDPGGFSSDDWNFPTNLLTSPGLIGRVHRGTPWQTIYLKAEVADATRWLQQAPDDDFLLRMHPINDWKLVSLFFSLWQTNDPNELFSINQTRASAWDGILGGMTAFSNSTPTYFRISPTLFDTLVIDSNSPQAEIIADAIGQARSSRVPAYFSELGQILATPALTSASPFLDLSAPELRWYSLNDEAMEKIPEQLLPLLRPDPILSFHWTNSQLYAQATAFAGYWYTLEVSRDLRNWGALTTHFADDATFDFLEPLPANTNGRFFRVRLTTDPAPETLSE